MSMRQDDLSAANIYGQKGNIPSHYGLRLSAGADN